MGGKRVLALVVLACGLARTAGAQPRFRVKAIIHPSTGTVEGTLGDAEQFAGTDFVGPNARRTPIYWTTTGKYVLPSTPYNTDAEALDMNARGQIVGRGYNDNLTPPYHALEWENGQVHALPVPQGFPYAEARGINALGDIIGHVADNQFVFSNLYRGAFWHDGQVTLIGGDRTALLDINARRQIVGCAGTTIPFYPTPDGRPFLWENGILRTLPGVSSTAAGCANAINDWGLIAGYSGGKPVIWRDGLVINIGPPGIAGNAADVNNRGEVVGVVETDQGSRSYFRPTSGGLYDLVSLVDPPTDPPLVVRGAARFNNAGELMMQATIPGREDVIVVLAQYLPTGADTQPPSITMTSPTTGAYLTDTAVLQATASDNVGVVGVQFFAQGLRVGRELTAPPYKAELDLIRFDDGPILVWARARDAAGNVSLTNLRSVFVSNHCSVVTPNHAISGWLGNQSGIFTVRWSGQANPGGDVMDGGFGLSRGRQTYFSGTAASVLWAPNGQFEVRDGDHYPTSGFPYHQAMYRFRMVVDVPNNRYSVWVRLLDEPEHQLAAGYAFRKPTTLLDSWMMRMDETATYDDLRICNVSVKPGP